VPRERRGEELVHITQREPYDAFALIAHPGPHNVILAVARIVELLPDSGHLIKRPFNEIDRPMLQVNDIRWSVSNQTTGLPVS
jgi:hypothetical protein